VAITRIGSAGGVSSATVPTHQVGDLILVYAFRDGSATAPTLPSGYANVGVGTKTAGSGSTAGAMRVGFKIATATNDTSGTWTNATEVVVVVYRPSAGNTLAIGASASNSGTTNTINYPALTLQATDGSSLVVGGVGHRSIETTIESPPTGMVLVLDQLDSTAELAVHDTNGGVTNWPSTNKTVTGTAAGWVSYNVEISIYPTPAFTHVQGAQTETAGTTSSLSAAFSSAVGSGSAVVGVATWDSLGGVTLSAVTDDKGNSYRIVDTFNDTTNNQAAASFVLGNIANAPKTITAKFSVATQYVTIIVDEYSGIVAAADPRDGNAVQSQTSVATTADAITSGSITTSKNGDLIWGAAVNISGSQAPVAGAGFTQLESDAVTSTAPTTTEQRSQTAAGAVAATFSAPSSATHITFVVALQAVTSASSSVSGSSVQSTAVGQSALGQALASAQVAQSLAVSQIGTAGSLSASQALQSVSLWQDAVAAASASRASAQAVQNLAISQNAPSITSDASQAIQGLTVSISASAQAIAAALAAQPVGIQQVAADLAPESGSTSPLLAVSQVASAAAWSVASASQKLSVSSTPTAIASYQAISENFVSIGQSALAEVRAQTAGLQSVGVSHDAEAIATHGSTAIRSFGIDQGAAASVTASASSAIAVGVDQSSAASASSAAKAASGIRIAQQAGATAVFAAIADLGLVLSQDAPGAVSSKALADNAISVEQTAVAAVDVTASSDHGVSIGQLAKASDTADALTEQQLSFFQYAKGEARASGQADQSVDVQQGLAARSDVMASAGNDIYLAVDSFCLIEEVSRGSAGQSLSIEQTSESECEIGGSSQSSIGIGQTAAATFMVLGSSGIQIGVGQLYGLAIAESKLQPFGVARVASERRVAVAVAQKRSVKAAYEGRTARVREQARVAVVSRENSEAVVL